MSDKDVFQDVYDAVTYCVLKDGGFTFEKMRLLSTLSAHLHIDEDHHNKIVEEAAEHMTRVEHDVLIPKDLFKRIHILKRPRNEKQEEKIAEKVVEEREEEVAEKKTETKKRRKKAVQKDVFVAPLAKKEKQEVNVANENQVSESQEQMEISEKEKKEELIAPNQEELVTVKQELEEIKKEVQTEDQKQSEDQKQPEVLRKKLIVRFKK